MAEPDPIARPGFIGSPSGTFVRWHPELASRLREISTSSRRCAATGAAGWAETWWPEDVRRGDDAGPVGHRPSRRYAAHHRAVRIRGGDHHRRCRLDQPASRDGVDSTVAPILAAGLGALGAVSESKHYIGLALVTTFLVGVFITLVIGAGRLGWVGDFLSRPVMIGFFGGIAVIIIINQIPASSASPRPTAGHCGRSSTSSVNCRTPTSRP